MHTGAMCQSSVRRRARSSLGSISKASKSSGSRGVWSSPMILAFSRTLGALELPAEAMGVSTIVVGLVDSWTSFFILTKLTGVVRLSPTVRFGSSTSFWSIRVVTKKQGASSTQVECVEPSCRMLGVD